MKSHNLHRGNILAGSLRPSTATFWGLMLILAVAVPLDARAQHSVDGIQQYIEQTEELLHWAQELVAETGSEPARLVLHRAATLHQSSKRMLSQGRRVESLAVARRARDAMWHAVRVAREAMGLDERIRVRVERFRDQYGHLSERAREARNEQALEFLERARQQADRARDIYHQGDFKLAWRLLEQAGDLMQRAARLLADSAGPERIDQDLERARQVIDNVRERLGDRSSTVQQQLLAEAEESLQRALAARDQGRPGRALQMSGLARNLARRAGQGGGGGPDADAVGRQLERFEVRAERLSDPVRESGSAPARKLYGRALEQRDRATTARKEGELERALRLVRAAHDLLNQVEDLIR